MPRVENLVQQAADRGDVDSFEDGIEAREADVPLETLGDPMGFGRTIAFLCLEHVSYINGVALLIDGGLIDASL